MYMQVSLLYADLNLRKMFFFPLIYYIPTVVAPPYSSSSPTGATFPLFSKEQGLPGILTNHSIASYNKARHNSHIKAGWDNLVGGKVSQEQAKESETLPLPLVGVPQDIKLHNHNMYAEDLAQTINAP